MGVRCLKFHWWVWMNYRMDFIVVGLLWLRRRYCVDWNCNGSQKVRADWSKKRNGFYPKLCFWIKQRDFCKLSSLYKMMCKNLRRERIWQKDYFLWNTFLIDVHHRTWHSKICVGNMFSCDCRPGNYGIETDRCETCAVFQPRWRYAIA